MQARVGARLAGRYRLDRQLGKGGMGTVWQAHDQVLDRMVAVKFVNAHGSTHPGAESRLRREARALGSVTHPNLAHVHDLCETDEGTFIVMELVHGESLAERLAGPTRPTLDQAADIAGQCALALNAAHNAGIVHRDVKPSNIMLAGDTVKLIDFGIAGSVNPVDTTVPGVMGTVAYLAPERVTGSPATPATDMYALGVVLYEMLAGHLPFQAEESIAMLYAHATADPLPLPVTTPTALAEATRSLLAKEPAARPEAGAVARELRVEAARGTATGLPAPPLQEAGLDQIALADRSPSGDPGVFGRRLSRGMLLPVGSLAAAVAVCTFLMVTAAGTPSAAVQPDSTPSPATSTRAVTVTSSASATPKSSNTTTYTSAHLQNGPGPLSGPAAGVAGPPAAKPGNPNPGNPNPGNPNHGNPNPGDPGPKPKSAPHK